jgi:hypothetical protein
MIMPEYKESSIAGTSYQRGRSLYFENPKGGTPSLLIREEVVTNLGDREITEHVSEIRKVVDDMSVVFDLRDPTTNELIEGATATYQDLYVLLFSLYWSLALARDEEAANPPVEEPLP